MQKLTLMSTAAALCTVALCVTASAATYSNNFDGFADGETNLGDGTVMAGTANIQGGALELTRDLVGGGFASFSVPPLAGSSSGWTASFDLTIFDSAGANEPADGMSVNYGDAALGTLGSAEEGMAGEASVNENISFEIDTWMNLDAEQGVNIAEKVGGADTDLAFTNGSILSDDSTVSGRVTASWDPVNGASFSTSGLLTNAAFSNVATSFVPNDTHTFIFSGRVGGANETKLIDNLVITTAPKQTFEVRVSQGSDDAEEHLTDDDGAANRMDLTSSDLELGAEGGAGDIQEIGIRFQGVAVPKGSIVTNAYVQFTTDETDDEPTSIQIFGELAGDAATYADEAGNISSRTKTASFVNWNDIPEWQTEGEAGPNQRTPNLAALVQEVIDQPDWAEGNSLALIISPNPGGERTAESFDGSAGQAPLLHVEFVPEPSTVAMSLIGLVCLGLFRKRRR